MRGAHRGVWCSKGMLLIEAELFAALIQRPAPSGRALICAANHGSKIPRHKAKGEHRQKSVLSFVFSQASPMRRPKEGQGSQEGDCTHLIRARRGKEDSGLRPKPFGVLSPFCPCRWAPVSLEKAQELILCVFYRDTPEGSASRPPRPHSPGAFSPFSPRDAGSHAPRPSCGARPRG